MSPHGHQSAAMGGTHMNLQVPLSVPSALAALAVRVLERTAINRFGRGPVAQLAGKATLAPAAGGLFDLMAQGRAFLGQTRQLVLGTMGQR